MGHVGLLFVVAVLLVVVLGILGATIWRPAAGDPVIAKYLGGHPNLYGPETVYVERIDQGLRLTPRRVMTDPPPPIVIPVSDIKSFDLCLGEQRLTVARRGRSGVGGALAGGLLLGPVGAGLGALARRRGPQYATTTERIVVAVVAVNGIERRLRFAALSPGPVAAVSENLYRALSTLAAPPPAPGSPTTGAPATDRPLR